MSTRRKIPPIIFTVITVVATVSLIGSTLNYIEFFTALQEIHLEMLDVNLAIGQSTVNITLIFAITNPTGYTGLRIRELSHELCYKEADSTHALHWWTSSYYQQPKPLDRYSNITFEEPIYLNVNSAHSQETSRFLEFYENHPQNIMWVLKCSAIFITFAGKIPASLTANKNMTYS